VVGASAYCGRRRSVMLERGGGLGRTIANRKGLRVLVVGLLLLSGGTSAPCQQIDAWPRIWVAGQPEIVVGASDMTCAGAEEQNVDVPDMPPSAFRRSDRSVVMLASNRNNFILEGPSLDKVARSHCASLLTSAHDTDPARFRDNEWLLAVLMVSDARAIGLVHDEYHGEEHGVPSCSRSISKERECWYAATTIVESNDGGRTFSRPAAPGSVIAALPYPFQAGLKRAGTGSPKALMNPRDGFLYVMVTFVDRSRGIGASQCLLRASPQNPVRWLAWDGGEFSQDIGSAYAPRRARDCVSVLGANVMSVKYLPRYKLFVAISTARDRLEYRFSSDLVHWSKPQLLRTFQSFPDYTGGPGDPLWYFSLLDPSSGSPNFDTLEGRPYLYFVRFHTDGQKLINRKRDIMRVAVTIDPPA
jgi:hypothetical protein